MEEKNKEWTKQKDMKEVVSLQLRKNILQIWKDIQKKNYYKSLDHRSFYFKQADKKQMNMKSVVEHIKVFVIPL